MSAAYQAFLPPLLLLLELLHHRRKMVRTWAHKDCAPTLRLQASSSHKVTLHKMQEEKQTATNVIDKKRSKLTMSQHAPTQAIRAWVERSRLTQICIDHQHTHLGMTASICTNKCGHACVTDALLMCTCKCGFDSNGVNIHLGLGHACLCTHYCSIHKQINKLTRPFTTSQKHTS